MKTYLVTYPIAGHATFEVEAENEIEAKKLAYADLVKYGGDPDFLTLTPKQILSEGFIKERRSHIDLTKAMPRTEVTPSMVADKLEAVS